MDIGICDTNNFQQIDIPSYELPQKMFNDDFQRMKILGKNTNNFVSILRSLLEANVWQSRLHKIKFSHLNDNLMVRGGPSFHLSFITMTDDAIEMGLTGSSVNDGCMRKDKLCQNGL
jgi:hypothetical protein